jgi:hypothetical protein
MEVDPTLITTAPVDFETILTQTAASFHQGAPERPSSAAVVAALLAAEKTAKQTRLIIPLAKLQGQWRLWFVAGRDAHHKAGNVMGKGRYVPKFAPAQISFLPLDGLLDPAIASADGEIGNQVQLGGLCLKLTGLYRYPNRKNLLAFDFSQVRLTLVGRTLYAGKFGKGAALAAEFGDRPLSQLPFFAFFLATDQLIAARGRGGGLALWIRA